MSEGRVKVTVCAAAGILALALLPAAARAGSTVKAIVSPQETESFWTSERYREARPRPIAELSAAVDAALADDESAEGAELSALADGSGSMGSISSIGEAAGRAPVAGLRADAQARLFEPLDAESAASEAGPGGMGSMAEPATGSAGSLFTSSRLVPVSADRSYPYLTLGRLYYTDPGHGTFYCSAVVIRPRVVVTAAQCVHSGDTSPGFYSNIQFVPAYRDGVAPFGTWNAAYLTIHSNWISTHGALPNATDYAVVELQDRTISGVVRRIGDVTGFLGYVIQKLRPNHAHLLAYTSSFDSGEKLHQVTGQSFRTAAATNVEYGSDLRSGSSGGAIIQDFGDNPNLVKWIGALSYVYTSTTLKVEGASTPDSRFTALVTAVCAHRAGNC
jgi:V8-like Glu-specific endopeptidase